MATSVWSDFAKGAAAETATAAELSWPVIDLNPEDWKDVTEKADGAASR